MKDIECPYCEEEMDINHDDGFGYDEDKTYQQECENCGKTFVFTTSFTVHHHAEKADCLNGGEHDYQPTITVPKEYTTMRCTMCDERRQPTKEEKEKHGIPPVDPS